MEIQAEMRSLRIEIKKGRQAGRITSILLSRDKLKSLRHDQQYVMHGWHTNERAFWKPISLVGSRHKPLVPNHVFVHEFGNPEADSR